MMEPVSFDFDIKEAPAKPWATTCTKMAREHNVINSLYLNPELLEKTNIERYKKYEIIAEKEALAEEYLTEDADIIIAAFGIAARVSRNAVNEARAHGIKAGLIRPITLWPFPEKVFAKAAEHAKQIISVELSMGQMIEDVKLSIDCKRPVSLCNRAGGMIPSPAEVLDEIKKIKDYSYFIINDDLSTALQDARTIIRAEHLRVDDRASEIIERYENEEV
jgi:2-oxoglutarate ferredoxin oxidoreductase subunit alpha